MQSKARCCKCFSPRCWPKQSFLIHLASSPTLFCSFGMIPTKPPPCFDQLAFFMESLLAVSHLKNTCRNLSPLKTTITENHDPQYPLLILPWVILKQWIPITINRSKWLSSLLVWRNDEQDNCRLIFTCTRSQNWHGLMTMVSWANSFLPVTSARILMQGLVH